MKRFAETRKWQNTWFMDLPAKYKLAWLWLVDNCDHAGLIDANPRLMSFMVGEPIDGEEFLRVMSGRVTKPKPGKWFIPSFINFQYGDELNPRNSAHRGVLRILSEQQIDCPVSVAQETNQAPNKGQSSPSKGAQDKDKDKDKEQDKDKGFALSGDQPKANSGSTVVQPSLPDISEAIPESIDTPDFRAAWADWMAYRKERRLTAYKAKSLAGQYKALADWGEPAAIASIRDSIRNQWQGLFQPKQSAPTPPAYREPKLRIE